MKLTLGFSPCPNDTFIFDALVHHKIDTEGMEFEVIFAAIFLFLLIIRFLYMKKNYESSLPDKTPYLFK